MVEYLLSSCPWARLFLMSPSIEHGGIFTLPAVVIWMGAGWDADE